MLSNAFVAVVRTEFVALPERHFAFVAQRVLIIPETQCRIRLCRVVAQPARAMFVSEAPRVLHGVRAEAYDRTLVEQADSVLAIGRLCTRLASLSRITLSISSRT